MVYIKHYNNIQPNLIMDDIAHSISHSPQHPHTHAHTHIGVKCNGIMYTNKQAKISMQSFSNCLQFNFGDGAFCN